MEMVLVFGRLDEFLLDRVFQPVADAMADSATPAEAARCCVTGAMVFVLAKMLVSALLAPPDWKVLLDLLSLWAGMAVLQGLTALSPGRYNPLREQFAHARRILAVVTLVLLLLGTRTLVESFALMQSTLWCLTLYFGSCTPRQRLRVAQYPRR